MKIPLAIINITPDSFSDGGVFFDEESIIKRIKFLKDIGVNHFDIGAQSTAPKNKNIGVSEELLRYKNLLTPRIIKELDGQIVSIDTFRPEVIFFIHHYFQKYSGVKLIWNDVSGVIDKSVVDFLSSNSSNSYILCHNLCPSREDSCDHMSYVNADCEDIVNGCAIFFKEKLSFIPSNLKDQVILDVCFGFSKTHEQNIKLIKRHYDLESQFNGEHRWVLGLSRKSFLKKSLCSALNLSHFEYGLESNYRLAILENFIIEKYFDRDCKYFIRSHLPENLVSKDLFDKISGT